MITLEGLIGKTQDEVIDLGINGLPNNFIYCPCCDKVMKFTVKCPSGQSGICGCDAIITETRKQLIWEKDNKTKTMYI